MVSPSRSFEMSIHHIELLVAARSVSECSDGRCKPGDRKVSCEMGNRSNQLGYMCFTANSVGVQEDLPAEKLFHAREK